jgi:hypothetical protein
VARGFLGWNIPKQYIRRRIALTQNYPSTFDVSNTSPSDISVHTPPSTEGMSPGPVHAVWFDVPELNAEKLMVGNFGALLRSIDGNGMRYKPFSGASVMPLTIQQGSGGLDESVLVFQLLDHKALG